MWRPRRKEEKDRGATAVAEPPRDFSGSTTELRGEIERLTERCRARRDPETERQLLWLRHLAGIRLFDESGGGAEFAEPDVDRLPDVDGLPEMAASDVTPGLLRAGILRDGCLLVRGLVGRVEATHFAGRIDQLFLDRDRGAGLYEEFTPHTRFGPFVAREWIKEGGGILAADSPALMFEMVELFRAAGLGRIVDGYLGEPSVISMHKTTLRKADPTVPGAWHQDGTFMGEVRALNVWLSLSHCGDDAPGLDIVPRRLDHLVATQTEEAVLPIQASQRKVEEAAGDTPIIRPIFEPGDALFFDELFMHQTASDPSMPNPRFAIESWFFGASGFPADYAPVAVS